MSDEKIQHEEEIDEAAWADKEVDNNADDEGHSTDLTGSESEDEGSPRRMPEYLFIKEEQLNPNYDHTTSLENTLQANTYMDFDTAISELHSHFKAIHQHKQAAEMVLNQLATLKQSYASNTPAQRNSTGKARKHNDIDKALHTRPEMTNDLPRADDASTRVATPRAVDIAGRPEALDTLRSNYINRARKRRSAEVDAALEPTSNDDLIGAHATTEAQDVIDLTDLPTPRRALIPNFAAKKPKVNEPDAETEVDAVDNEQAELLQDFAKSITNDTLLPPKQHPEPQLEQDPGIGAKRLLMHKKQKPQARWRGKQEITDNIGMRWSHLPRTGASDSGRFG
jgi:hypothetical protein